jgi:O-antigen/teichoic acid export membrane protein
VTPTPSPARPAELWGRDDGTVRVVAHNVSTRYLAYLVDAVLGLVMLPFNLSHLGMAAYGLWMLTTSFTAYFAMLDLGYGGALVRFVAQYRARRDARALNEVLSTMSVVYTSIGVVTYLVVLAIAFNMDLVGALTPDQRATSRTLLLLIGANVALRFAFGPYGGVIVGFQRYHLNNLTSIATSLVVAAANVAVLLAGHGIVTLVAVTTGVRIAALLVYRMNAYRVFPGLAIDWRLYSRARLREVSGFGVFMLLLDTAYKLNYSTDMVVIGAWLGAPAVALWAPAQRLSELMLKLSNQVSEALFPIVVDCDASEHAARLRTLFLHGTRLSLATVLPVAGGLALLAHPLLTAWIGPSFAATTTIVQILAFVVIVRVGSSTSSVVLKGAGQHRRLTTLVGLMAVGNLALSIALVRTYGLVGVAVGTAVPVTLVAVCGLVPAACRRVEMPFGELFRGALWPALWPALFTGWLLVWSRTRLPATLPAVALQLAIGSAVYFAVFLVAVGHDGRREYVRHVDGLLKRTSRQVRVGTANAS